MRKPRRIVVAVIILAFILLLIIISEIVLRVKCTVCTWAEGNGLGYVSPYKVPPWATWYCLRRPNTTTKSEPVAFDFEITTNSMGIRDVDHPRAKSQNEIRIIGMGDSYTEGAGAEFEDSYLKVLERHLNEQAEGKRIRVISGAVSGSDPCYSYMLLKDKLLPFDPDLVTLAINSSDIFDLVTRGGMERFQENGKVKFAKPPRREWLWARSHLFRLVMIGFFHYDISSFSPSERTAKWEEAVNTMSNAVKDFQKLSLIHGFKFLVILHPDFSEVKAGRYTFNVAKLKRTMDDFGIDYVDILPSFMKAIESGQAAETLFWTNRDWHNNAAGYRLFAKALEGFLLESGLLALKER